MELTKVSVVIVNFNAGPGLVASVATATKGETEVILVDNASSDGSPELLEREFVGSPRLKIIRNGRNIGFAAACNMGVEAATARRILFLNPDCELHEDALARMLAILESDPRIGMVGGMLLNEDGSEQAGGRRAIPTPWRSFVRATGLSVLGRFWPRLFADFVLHRTPLPDGPIDVEAISGACMLVRREALDEVGLLDEGYFLHCEDLDLCMRLRRSEWRIVFVPSAKMVHFKGACSRSHLLFVEWNKHKGMIRFYRKFFRDDYPGLLMALIVVGVWCRFPLSVVYRGILQISAPTVRATRALKEPVVAEPKLGPNHRA